MEALHKVIETPELLELILLHLDARTLLHSQRTNRSFYELIKHSPYLQQALFFRPQSAANPKESTYRTNPLLRDAFPTWFKHSMSDSMISYHPIHWNNPSESSIFEALPWNSNPEATSAFKRQEASWRRMLVTQPPVLAFDIQRTAHHWDSDVKRGRIDFGKNDGLRMGILYDLVEQFLLREQSVAYFAVQWRMFPSGSKELLENEVKYTESFPGYEPYMAEILASNSDADETGKRWWESDFEPENRVTLNLAYTPQCSVGIWPDPKPQFESDGFEDARIRFEQDEGLDHVRAW
ncbi:hypothetical protein LTS18_009714 [Coniosporium uncinatum]|uniref:Uncharacterized protein n=1 Tax=Coniosporium uncinatum TaxID=93489 RepID=A0ACC3D069_9PEZI|nr:hypothetical protein LTS18_009714 [Coniosporium uncinatum]